MSARVVSTFVRTNELPTCGPRVFDNNHDDVVCPACEKTVSRGERTVLVVLGPGDDAEARQRASVGAFYNAACLVVHLACARGTP